MHFGQARATLEHRRGRRPRQVLLRRIDGYPGQATGANDSRLVQFHRPPGTHGPQPTHRCHCYAEGLRRWSEAMAPRRCSPERPPSDSAAAQRPRADEAASVGWISHSALILVSIRAAGNRLDLSYPTAGKPLGPVAVAMITSTGKRVRCSAPVWAAWTPRASALGALGGQGERVQSREEILGEPSHRTETSAPPARF